jgi:hypothetical protein
MRVSGGRIAPSRKEKLWASTAHAAASDPKDYRIAIVAGSDTEAVEMALVVSAPA